MIRIYSVLLGILALADLGRNQRECPTGNFQCDSGQCISLAWRCNGRSNCDDGTDEQGCNYGTCAPNTYQCPSSSQCIPFVWLCDGFLDCPNGQDETQNCPAVTCASDQFQCDNGFCISSSWQCDHIDDCFDNSDEQGCNFPACSDQEWTCTNGECIDTTLRCNGAVDCWDRSDEDLNCTNVVCHSSMSRCGSGECLPSYYQCDHYSDCWDASDEANCTHDPCLRESFTCASGQCIPSGYVCDGIMDCSDASDELQCVGTFSCPPQQWPCHETLRKCIPINKLCDGRQDCPNGEDERAPCNTRSCGFLSCEYQCHSAPNGGTCYCDAGYVVSSNNRTCEDFDECGHWGYCEQECVNTPSSYQCSCQDGYQLQSGGHCRSLALDTPFLLVSLGQTITRSDINGYRSTTITTTPQPITPGPLAYHYAQGKIFYSSGSEGKIYSCNFAGGNPDSPQQVLQLSGNLKVSDIAVDWISNKLYLVENTAGRIEVAELDGSHRSTIIGSHLSSPSGLALDPVNGYMFFGDAQESHGYVSGQIVANQKLERAFMDGSHRFMLTDKKIYTVSGISVDIPARRVYWVDHTLDCLVTMTYDGHKRFTILQGGLALPNSQLLAIYDRYAFIADHTRDGVLRTDRFDWTSDATVTLPSSVGEASGLTVYHSSLQPSVPSPCGTDNGGCQHLCLITRRSDNQGIGYQCKCDIGYQLNDDLATCSKVTSFLLVCSMSVIRGLLLDGSSDDDCIQPYSKLDYNNHWFTSNVEYDAASETMFYRKNTSTLVLLQLDGTNTQEISARGSYWSTMSYDWLSKNLYETYMPLGLIVVLKMDGIYETRTVIYQNRTSTIVGIAVAPLGGYLFVVDWKVRQIQRMWLDGTHLETILDPHELNNAVALTVDHRDSLLYWSSFITDSIWYCDFNGESRMEVQTRGLAPWFLTVFQDYAYYYTKTGIYRVNKTQGSWPRKLYPPDGVFSYYQVQVYSPELQTGENQCSRHGLHGDCSHFCFGTPTGQRTCGCPSMMKLAADQRTCVADPDAVSPWICTRRDFTCDDGSCIRVYDRCDGLPDCPNGEDENACAGECQTSTSCTDDPNICVPWWKVCDDDNYCADGSDEVNCTANACTASSFHCQDGTCIPASWRCDTTTECPDGSDEVDCESYTCPPDHFSCATVLRCISGSEVCDGFNDCGDRSDESHCVSVNCSRSWMFTCSSGSCIPSMWQCDNVPDCSDGSDELDCTSNNGCSSDTFRCTTSGVCIRSRWECDGVADCEDGSDEPETCPPIECEGISCGGTCVPNHWICDGVPDCVDGTDEEACPTPAFACPEDNWQCPGTTDCVALTSVCDLTEDCPHGEDEGPLCNDDLCSVRNGGCSHTCTDTPFGAACSCPDGYTVDTDMKDCQDIDECTIVGTCSQECSNRRGAFLCLCTDGYLLEPDGRTCKVTDPSTPHLIASSSSGVKILSLRNNEESILPATYRKRISSSDFDSVTGNIYYFDAIDNVLLKTNISGSSAEVVYTNGMALVEGIAVDWVGRNIYWTDSRINVIEVASLDRDHRAILLSQNISRPSGLCLDPSQGSRYLFWAEAGQNPRLERASMDGQNRRAIISDDLYWPRGVTLDLPNKKVYFGDSRLDFIDSCDYDGGGRRRVVMRSMGNARLYSVTIFEDYLYWTDIGNREMLQAKKFNGENMTAPYTYMYGVLDIHVYHPVKQPPGPNPCNSNTCSHLCVLSSAEPGYSCLCPVGQTPQPDGSCSMIDVFLLVIHGGLIQGISLDPTDLSLNQFTTVTAIRDAYDVDFDKDGEFVYWSEAVVEGHEEDSATRSVMRAEFSGVNSSSEFVPTAYLGSPVGIAIDHLSRNIYWTNPDKHTIEVMQLDGDRHYRRPVVENSGGEESIISDPVTICLDPGSGMMYWADNGGMGVDAQINRANMDGSMISSIVSDDLGHVDFLTIDIAQHKLYWTESIGQLIERCSVDGSGRQTVVEGVHHGMGLAVYENYLYYADSAYEKIVRVDKDTGQNPVVMRSNLRHLRGMRIFARLGPTSNGCSTSNGGCQHLCLPTGPSARVCACAIGYILNSDGVTCGNLSSFAVVSQLRVTRGFGLESADHPEAMVPIGGRTRYTLHVDVHASGEYIYFADYDPSSRRSDRNGIRRIKPDGSGFQNIALTGLGYWGTRGLTVDWIAGNVYWSDAHRTESFIEVSRLDGSLRRVLWKTLEHKPRTLAVNPVKRYLYWADYGQTPKIVRAFLDCSNRSELVTVGISVPRDIAVDVQTHDVFWVDTVTDVLEKMDWRGGNRQIIRSQLPNPFGLAVFSNSVYWVDRNLETIFKASKLANSNKDPEVFRTDMEKLRDIAIFDASNQPPADDNPCGVNNGGCEQLCLAMPDEFAVSRVCLCAFGDLAQDGQSCLNSTSYLVFCTYWGCNSLNFDPLNHALPFQFIPTDYRSSGVAIHERLQRLYWIRRSMLKYVSIHGGSIVDVKAIPSLGYSVELAIDWLHSRIYITSYSNDAIYTVDLEGNNLLQIAVVNNPNQIIVNPCEGTMYYLTGTWGTRHMYRSSMGGSRQQLLTTFTSYLGGMAMDYTDNWLYFMDTTGEGAIKRIKTDGSVQETILENMPTPRRMAVHGDYLYYSTSQAIMRVEKDTGSNPTDMLKISSNTMYEINVFNGDQPTCTSSPCAYMNGGCSDECLPDTAGDRTCACPEGLLLRNQGRVCVPMNATCNDNTEYTCADGSCIPESFACDVDNDCGDWSDERPSFCFDHRCENSEYMCNNSRCIPSSWRCDYDNDCRDNSDEINCPFPTCEAGEFTCPNARCIPESFLCDEDDDCRDGNHTDEQNCPEVICRSNWVSCPNNHICILRYWLCDGDNDCLDNSDEDSLYCEQQECQSTGHRCATGGQCISGYWLCDGEVDCQDGSDEGAFCYAEEFTCSPNYFTCDNNKCIPVSWICDTDNDCGDGSDEDERHNCDTHQCAPEYYTCRQNRPNRNRCIPRIWLCDGLSDCEHADDEENCTRTTCVGDDFTCGNGLCIPASWECDHDNDCGDQSDEGGQCDYGTCTDSEFTCNNGRCIPSYWHCDGDNDCRDYSDERNCATDAPCASGQFTCLNGDPQCIPNEHVCDKTNDCSDMSDEFHCDINECLTLEANQCQQYCNDTRTGYFCSCQPGYSLNDDGKTCRDDNECNEILGVCSQLCVNTRGSYFCKCAEGYTRELDMTTCKHTEGGDASLIFSNRYYIRKLSLDGQQYDLIKDDLYHAIALDYDLREGRLYYLDTGSDKIHRMFLNGSGDEVIVPYAVARGQGLAVDWVGRKLYWVDSSIDVMEVSELDGTLRKTIVYQDMSQPRALSLDPRNGYVYWTDWGLRSYIGRMGMDGSSPMRIIDEGLVWPNGLTICYACNKLYWADAHLNYIGYSNLDGSHIHKLPGEELAHPFAVSVFEDYVYWSDWNHMGIYRANKSTGANVTLMREVLHMPYDVHVLHPLRQDQTLENPCGINNGGCSHLCLLSPNGGYTCACPDNFLISGSNGQNCLANCSALQYRCDDNSGCIPIHWKCDTEADCPDGSDEPASCPVRHCDLGYFQCLNLNCAAGAQLCNGVNDCGDNTDESMCDQNHCQPWEFRCSSGNCIRHTEVCDRSDDCSDGSDEDMQLCQSRTCSPGYFQCDNGFCIPESWHCDFDNDCGDNSDEPHRYCQQVTCPAGWEPCRTNYRCLPSWAFCNGYDNCRDNSDEENCEARTCDPGTFRCDDHACIPQRWVCDFEVDCSDRSDEPADCPYRDCSESEFRCGTEQCIPNRWVCDHDNDCGDLTDEMGCLDYDCQEGYTKCASGHCIRESYVCDGDRDCLDYSDELNCPTRLPNGLYCYATEFTCNNTLCIRKDWVCDGDNDCGDGSDEILSICAWRECDLSTHYRCTNGRCIPLWKTCDEIDDCGDASDENNHDLCAVQCPEETYKCPNDFCIPIFYVCDEYEDCEDGSDEIGCNDGGCAEATCEEGCRDTAPGGHVCTCAEGHRVGPDHRGCEDINECQDNPCPQLCRNTKGSHYCQCASGYVDRESQGMDCKPNGSHPIYVFGDGSDIRRYDENTRKYTAVVSEEGLIQDVDYHVVQDAMYWVDTAHSAVKRGRFPANEDQEVVVQKIVSGINKPQGIAVDWVSGNVYWTDLGVKPGPAGRKRRQAAAVGPRIAVAKLDGRYVKDLVTTDIEKPTAIAINPFRGLLYWSDTGATPKIEMAWMNGAGRIVLVTDRISNPTGLTIDFANYDTVYFCDNKESRIESMSWNGENRKLLKAGSTLEHAYQLEVFGSFLYMTTNPIDVVGQILKLDKLGRGIPTTLIDNIDLPSGLVVRQEERYPASFKNRCDKSPCSHLCLLTPTIAENRVTDGFSCECANGEAFMRESTTDCTGAKVEPNPLPGLPICQCDNGGSCITPGKCQCPKGFKGDTCSEASPMSGGPGGGVTAAIILVVLIVVIALSVLAFILIRRQRNNSLRGKEGVVSYRGGTNIDMPTQHPGTDGAEVVEKGSTAGNFENPVYNMQSPTLQAVGDYENVAPTAQADALPPKVDLGADLTQAGPLPEKTGLPTHAYTPTEAEGDTNVLVMKEKM